MRSNSETEPFITEITEKINLKCKRQNCNRTQKEELASLKMELGKRNKDRQKKQGLGLIILIFS